MQKRFGIFHFTILDKAQLSSQVVLPIQYQGIKTESGQSQMSDNTLVSLKGCCINKIMPIEKLFSPIA
mgnify:CR=1 FL=1